MKIAATLFLAATCLQAQLSSDARVKLSQQLQQESVDLENKVCPDPTYKPYCDQVKKTDLDEIRTTLAKFGPRSTSFKQAQQKAETDLFALEDKLYADPKYSKAYKHIQLLHEQLGIPHHGKSQ